MDIFMFRTAAIPSGGVLVNDALFHFGNYFIPFGGVGSSGLGGYHGRCLLERFIIF
jgi:aldehyde dehydrogenase (NAD+)